MFITIVALFLVLITVPHVNSECPDSAQIRLGFKSSTTSNEVLHNICQVLGLQSSECNNKKVVVIPATQKKSYNVILKDMEKPILTCLSDITNALNTRTIFTHSPQYMFVFESSQLSPAKGAYFFNRNESTDVIVSRGVICSATQSMWIVGLLGIIPFVGIVLIMIWHKGKRDGKQEIKALRAQAVQKAQEAQQQQLIPLQQ